VRFICFDCFCSDDVRPFSSFFWSETCACNLSAVSLLQPVVSRSLSASSCSQNSALATVRSTTDDGTMLWQGSFGAVVANWGFSPRFPSRWTFSQHVVSRSLFASGRVACSQDLALSINRFATGAMHWVCLYFSPRVLSSRVLEICPQGPSCCT
jgi:hypothetical protein